MLHLVAPLRSGTRTENVDDRGFTVLEVVMSIVLVTIVMTALAGFYVTNARATDAQSLRQSAVQVAASAIAKARNVTNAGPTIGRDASSTTKQWTDATKAGTPYPGVAAYLVDPDTDQPRLTMAYDPTAASGNGAKPTTALPTTGRTVSVDDITFTQNWFLGYCKRNAADGSCSPGAAGAASTYLQILVDVTWNDRSCGSTPCSYITSTFVSSGDDPVFDPANNAQPPVLKNPGNQTSEVGVPVMLPITVVSGGSPPYTWITPNLPPGLQWGTDPSVCTSGDACVYGTPTTKTTTPISVVLNVSDAFGYTDTETFTWTVIPAPAIGALPDRGNRAGDVVSFVATATGGSGSYDWSDTTGLPPGITITGVGPTATIAGSPSRGGTYSTVVRVTDSLGGTDTETFVWTVKLNAAFTGITANGPYSNHSGQYQCVWGITMTSDGPFVWKSDNPAVTQTTTNNTRHVDFSFWTPKGKYTMNWSSTQTDGKAPEPLTGTLTCNAGVPA